MAGFPLRIFAVLCFVASLAGWSSAWAQVQPPLPLTVEQRLSLEESVDAIFQELLEDPGNLQKTFRYAELSARLGDYEAAISSLERMLLFNPDLHRVRLELGVMYFRLGSYLIAKNYFERAVSGPEVPVEVQARVEAFLVEIDRRLSPHQFGGSLFAGGRYQSNANAGPLGARVKVFGLDATLEDQFARQEDFNVLAVLSAYHNYDFRNSRGAVWETSAAIYASEQFEQTQLNLLFVEVTTGPRMRLFSSDVNKASIRPYVIANVVTLDRNLYFGTGGGGVEITRRLGERVNSNLHASGRWRRYHNTQSQPRVSERDAFEVDTGLGLQFLLAPDVIFSTNGAYRRTNADNDINSYDEYTASAGLSHSFDGLWQSNAGQWVMSVTAARVWSNYKDIDPTIDPFTLRRDRAWHLSGGLNIPLNRKWTASLGLGYSNIESSLPNFEYDNTFINVGIAWRF